MRHVLQLIVISLAVTGVAVGAGLLVTLGHDRTDPAARTPTTTSTTAPAVPLAALDTTHLAVARAAFCDGVPDADVAAALGDEPDGASSYASGDRGQITRSTSDVADEFDCTWSRGRGKHKVTARAWVFAPPITPDRARTLAREQERARSCDPLADPETFGSPAVATSCRTRAGEEVSYRGLFGAAWLTCALTDPGTGPGTDADDALRARAEAWCSTVVQAASA